MKTHFRPREQAHSHQETYLLKHKSRQVLFEFKKHRILLPDNYVKTVVHLILEYIEQIGGMLE